LPPIICAGISDRGINFTIEHCTGSFMTGGASEDFMQVGRRAKKLAAEANKPGFKTYGLFTIVTAHTDNEAQERVDLFNSGVDRIALANQSREYGGDKSAAQNNAAQFFLKQGASASAMFATPIVGSPSTVADKLAQIVRGAELSGITVIVPDFIDDLRVMGTEVVSGLADRGVFSNAAATPRG
jgi:pyrimidine oxygenase